MRIPSATHQNLRRWSRPPASGRICSTASTSSSCACRRCGSAPKTSPAGRNPPARLSESPACRRCVSAKGAAGAQGLCLPGNVRELENILERWPCQPASSSRPTTCSSTLRHGRGQPGNAGHPGGADLQEYLDQGGAPRDRGGPRKSGGNRTAAARALGVTFRSLRYRLERLGIKE